MGSVKIRYYVTRKPARVRLGYWLPTKKMKAAGFHNVCCGEDGPHAWAIAQQWNARWDEVKARLRNGEPADPKGIEKVYPPCSLGEAYQRFKKLSTWKDGKKARTKEDWERGWKLIEPIFGDVDPSTVALEDVDGWYASTLKRSGVREAHRAMKIWRALWRVAGSMNNPAGAKYCSAEADPSLGIRRRTPTPRNQIWFEGEAVRLVKAAIRMGYLGLATALAVAWDTMLSPVDVRTLTRAQLRGDVDGSLFALARAKTGKAAIGTLSKRAERLLNAYLGTLPPNLLPTSPIFMTRGHVPTVKGGRPRPRAPYTADTLGDDFRAVREAVFPGDRRTLMDFRRSGAVEAKAGAVDPHALADKMANTIDSNKALQSTYLPPNARLVRLADEARSRGRKLLRGQNGSGAKS